MTEEFVDMNVDEENYVELSIRFVKDVMDLRADMLNAFNKFGFFINLRQYMCGFYLCGRMSYGNCQYES